MDAITLEGVQAQLRGRLADIEVDEPPAEGRARAAVAVVLRDNDGLELLLIRRADDPRDYWSGQIALPGGRWEPADVNLAATAVRETLEEVGVDLSYGRVFGRLEVLRPSSHRLPPIDITPFVAVAPPDSLPTPSPEVADCFWVPLEELRRTGRSSSHRMELDGRHYEWPAYPLGEHVIWGLTERILTRFLELLADQPVR
jgi:8-oxo-dGTP pyrophosphatase MutT (NUDIX family)